jgi:hypothetical protein
MDQRRRTGASKNYAGKSTSAGNSVCLKEVADIRAVVTTQFGGRRDGSGHRQAAEHRGERCEHLVAPGVIDLRGSKGARKIAMTTFARAIVPLREVPEMWRTRTAAAVENVSKLFERKHL